MYAYILFADCCENNDDCANDETCVRMKNTCAVKYCSRSKHCSIIEGMNSECTMGFHLRKECDYTKK